MTNHLEIKNVLWKFLEKSGIPWKFLSCKMEALSRFAGLRSAVGNVSGYRCVSDCISRGREFDPGPVPYFRRD